MLNTFFGLKNIKTVTVQMNKPLMLADGSIQRTPRHATEKNMQYVSQEQYLRKLAYEEAGLALDDRLFCDMDMNSDYYFILVYCVKSTRPLLSMRFYYSKNVIQSYLKSNDTVASELDEIGKGAGIDVLSEVDKNNICFVDRLAGDKKNDVFRKYRNYIFSQIYVKLVSENKDKLFLTTACSDRYEKLLTKYLRIGFSVMGNIDHDDEKYWILLGGAQKNYLYFRKTALFNSFLAFRLFSVGVRNN